MALATKCPHCTTIFRVAHDQLKLRGGIVRCGACNEVFDGNAALVEPAPKQPVIIDLPAAPTAAPATSPELDALITSLDARHGGMPAGKSAPAFGPEPAPAQEPAPLPAPVQGPAVLPRLPAEAEPAAAPAPDRAPGKPESPLMPVIPVMPVMPVMPDAGLDADLDLELNLDPEQAAPAAMGPLQPAIPTLNHPAAASDELFDLDFNVDDDSLAGAVHAPPPWDDKRAPLPEIRSALPGTRGAEIEALLLELDHDIEAAQLHELNAEHAPDELAPEPPFASPAHDSAGEPEPEPLRTAYPPLSALDDEDRQDAASGDNPADAGGGRREPTLDAPDEHLTAVALHDSVELDAYPPRADSHRTVDGAGQDAAVEVEEDGDGDEDRVTLSHAATGRQADQQAEAGTAAAVAAPVAQSTAPATPLSSGEAADGDEPGFVKRDRRRKQFGKAARIAMAAGIPLLLAALAAQVLGTFRNPLAAAVPALKPALVSACALAGCKVELPAQIDALSIEQGELQTLADKLFSFGTTLRNGSRNAQAWPHIELILNDAADKPVLRRVFAPREYLVGVAGASVPAAAGNPAAPADAAKGFAPRSEQSVKLYFELPHVKASGYHIAVFYP